MTDKLAEALKPIRMRAYYYGFDETGVREIDEILSAVACAGKAYHYTADWAEDTAPYELCHTGDTPVQWIQNAAIKAAEKWNIRHESPNPATSDDVREAIEHCQMQIDDDYNCGTLNKESLQTVINAALRNTQAAQSEVVTVEDIIADLNDIDHEYAGADTESVLHFISDAYPNGLRIVRGGV